MSRPIDLPESIAPRMFDTKPGARHLTLAAGDLTVEPIICWENLFADDVRTTATDEPTVIAHLVNDGSFGPTAQPKLHDLVSVMRAVESDRPVVIASNMGPSQIIDAKGRVLARTSSFFASSYVTANVTMPSGQTPYRRYGDWTWMLPPRSSCSPAGSSERTSSDGARAIRDGIVPTSCAPMSAASSS